MANKAKYRHEKQKKELEKGILLYALLFVFMFGGFLSNVMETFPAREELSLHRGGFEKLERRKYGRRSRAYGLILENGESFYIHPDFDADEFKRSVSAGNELLLQVADIRQFRLFSRISEPVVYEILTADGMLLRDFEATIDYLKEMRTVRMITYGMLSILFAGMLVFQIHKLWRVLKV